MNWGCLSFIILFPVGIFIWARGEQRRRAALPTEELQKLEAEEDYGPIDENLECIFCHSRNCVRAELSLEDKLYEDLKRSRQEWANLQFGYTSEKNIFKAYCMKCRNNWEFYPAKEEPLQ